ncbi:MAG: lipopolysaccharide transport periplasmic protein LptA [Gammaproteobacteria bacterium]|nr:lipopolysaccharide transport periplasmic protein LptA [Gammaproteobacteria bacterium]
MIAHWLPRTLARATACALLLLSLPGYTLPEDKQRPIHIEADEAIRDEKTGLTLYRGNVRIRQGSLKISAEQVTLYHINTQADKIVALGSPARIQQQRTLDSEPMHAEGGIIEYYKEEERVHIRENAKLEQGGSTVRSDSIEYFINRELVRATTDDPTSTQRRVEVVILPPVVEGE